MRIFALMVVASPVWLHYGFKWLTNDATIKGKYLLAIIGAGALVAFVLADSRNWNELAYIPVITTICFAVLGHIEARISRERPIPFAAPQKRVSPVKIDLEKLKKLEAIRAKAKPLLEATEQLSNDILRQIHSMGGQSPMPGLIHADSDALRAAYSLVYAAYMDKSVRDPAHRHALMLSMYQSEIVSNLLPLAMPKLRNVGPIVQSDIENESLRRPIREIIKLQSRLATEVLANLRADSPNPFLPIYQNFRPYFSSSVTDEDLAKMFEGEFKGYFSVAKKEVFAALL